jgi:hypothetical protein
MLLTWQQLAELIKAMPESKRFSPVLRQDENTGDFVGFSGIRETEAGDSMDEPALPEGTLILKEDQSVYMGEA